MKQLDNDIMQSLDVLMRKGCIVNNSKTELTIKSTSSSLNGFLYQFISILYIRLTNCGLYNDLVITGEKEDYGLNARDWRMIKSGYRRACKAGEISFYDDDGYGDRKIYTFIFSPTEEL